MPSTTELSAYSGIGNKISPYDDDDEDSVSDGDDNDVCVSEGDDGDDVMESVMSLRGMMALPMKISSPHSCLLYTENSIVVVSGV